jgi:hypothetical protein
VGVAQEHAVRGDHRSDDDDDRITTILNTSTGSGQT